MASPGARKEDMRIKGLYSLLKRRGFFWPSYEIYGGVAGFFDLGPLGSILKDNVERLWKRIFQSEEGFLFLDSPSIAPEEVYRASGHMDKFSDILVRCEKCSSPFRADHLLEDRGEGVGELDVKEGSERIAKTGIKCPNCGGELGSGEDFNLMFSTYIGPGKERKGYLRPETAQSIFMDFNELYRYNREKKEG